MYAHLPPSSAHGCCARHGLGRFDRVIHLEYEGWEGGTEQANHQLEEDYKGWPADHAHELEEQHELEEEEQRKPSDSLEGSPPDWDFGAFGAEKSDRRRREETGRNWSSLSGARPQHASRDRGTRLTLEESGLPVGADG
jgi:hypothetical protein